MEEKMNKVFLKVSVMAAAMFFSLSAFAATTYVPATGGETIIKEDY